jgi:hypothetical protein
MSPPFAPRRRSLLITANARSSAWCETSASRAECPEDIRGDFNALGELCVIEMHHQIDHAAAGRTAPAEPGVLLEMHREPVPAPHTGHGPMNSRPCPRRRMPRRWSSWAIGTARARDHDSAISPACSAIETAANARPRTADSSLPLPARGRSSRRLILPMIGASACRASSNVKISTEKGVLGAHGLADAIGKDRTVVDSARNPIVKG